MTKEIKSPEVNLLVTIKELDGGYHLSITGSEAGAVTKELRIVGTKFIQAITPQIDLAIRQARNTAETELMLMAALGECNCPDCLAEREPQQKNNTQPIH